MRPKKNNISIRFILLLLISMLAYKFSAAQEISFTASAPRVLRAGEQFQLSYTTDDKISDFTVPDFGKFQYLGGPGQSSSTSVNFVNGRASRVSSYTYTYYVQAPSEAGKYTIPPATATYKKKTVSSNPLEIEVVASSGQTRGQSTGTESQPAGQTQASDKDIYVRLELDKTTAYVGEQITAWVKLYVHPNLTLSGFDQQFKGPEFTGFFRQDVELPPLTSLERVKVGDDIYHLGILRKIILYPQKSGESYIEPFDLLVELQTQQRRRPQSIFDEFMYGSQFQRKRINLRSKGVKLNIKPLPGNQPLDFSGAVGNFKISATANPTEIVTNDAVSFKVTVSGKGNIKLIDGVASHFPPTFEVFDPIRKVQLDENTQGKTGQVSFEYTAIPRHAGNFEIPPFDLVYFDPENGRYRTISTSAFRINVVKGEGDSTTMVSGNFSKEAIELLGSDIRYIEPETDLLVKDNYIFGRMWFYEVYITLFLLFIGILIFRKEQIKRSADVTRLRNRKAGKVVSRRLRKASKLYRDHQIKEFFDELERALWGYMADKLNIPVSEMATGRVSDELTSRGLPEELSNEFIQIIESCQYARYAPGGMEAEMSGLFERSKAIISKLDQKL